jgi:hypothetical protein
MEATITPAEGDFWRGLFDMSFTLFITPQLIRVLYILGMLVAVIIAVGACIVALTESIWAFIWTLIFAPVWLAVVFVILRIIGELAIVVFRIAQASIVTAQNTGSNRPA